MMLPDALLALWLKFLVDGALDGQRDRVIIAGVGLAVSVTATWYLSLLSQRVQRRFRDRVAIALESHVAHLQASVPTIEHHERPEYLDRLAMLRDQVFALDHMFMSLFSTLGWLFRLAITAILLASIHPALVLLMRVRPPGVLGVDVAAGGRAPSRGVGHRQHPPGPPPVRARHDGAARQGGARHQHRRLADQRAPSRVGALVRDRCRRFGWVTAAWHTAAWAVFAGAYVAAIVYVATGLDRSVGDVVLVLAAGTRLARYVGATAGELGFLRGFWLDSSRRLAWLEDYAAGIDATATASAPTRLTDGIDVRSPLVPATRAPIISCSTTSRCSFRPDRVVAVVGENGAGKSTLVKLLARMYAPTAGRITVDGVDLADIAIDEWRTRLAGAFQDFYRFELHAQQTVGVGDLPRLDDRTATQHARSTAPVPTT